MKHLMATMQISGMILMALAAIIMAPMLNAAPQTNGAGVSLVWVSSETDSFSLQSNSSGAYVELVGSGMALQDTTNPAGATAYVGLPEPSLNATLYNYLLGRYGGTLGEIPDPDANSDGKVDISDLIRLLRSRQ